MKTTKQTNPSNKFSGNFLEAHSMDSYLTTPPFLPLSFHPSISSSYRKQSRNMKLIKNYFPKNFFKSKKRCRSRSDESTTTSSSSNKGGFSTPTSVLPTSSNEWSDLVQALSVIRREKLEAILSRVGGKSPPSEEELGLLLNELEDKSGDGCVSLEEFDVLQSPGGGDMKDAFDFFDEDHDGKITAEELFNVFRMMGDDGCTLEECKDMIASVDKNGDGFVCFDDFCLMMEQQ